MAEEITTALIIYDSVLFDIGHNIRRWAEAVERGVTWNAIRLAPVRSGELVAGIHGDVDRPGPKQLVTTIVSEAEHTMYVIGGTMGPIMSDDRWAGDADKPMVLRAGNGYPRHYSWVVEGQEANNFLAEAIEATANRHSSLRGFSPMTNF